MDSKYRARAQRLKKFFNLTVEEWEKINQYQALLCAICGKPQKSGRRLATDHDHRGQGIIRGLLCGTCNRALGRMERTWDKNTDVVLMLERMALFLKDPPAVKALGREIYTFPGRFGTKRHRKYLVEQKRK